MATDLRQLPAYFTTDADFRAWGSGLAAQLTAVGLVQASDTGQINWGTVLKPASAAVAGYEIWRFNDALQATKPVFIKVEYGQFNNGVMLKATVATASNGAGTLTGQLGTVYTAYGLQKAAGNTLPSYCSGSSSRLNLCTHLDAASASYSVGLFIERTKTAAGVDTGDAIVTWLTFQSDHQFQVIPFSGSIPTKVQTNMSTSLTSAGISSVGGNVALSPTIAPLGKAYFASWATYMHADLGELQPIQVNHLGAMRTMMPLGDGYHSGAVVQGTVTGHSLVMLWE